MTLVYLALIGIALPFVILLRSLHDDWLFLLSIVIVGTGLAVLLMPILEKRIHVFSGTSRVASRELPVPKKERRLSSAATQSPADELEAGRNYALVGFWCYWYLLKSKSWSSLAAAIAFIASFFELASLLLHPLPSDKFPRFASYSWESPSLQIGVFVILMLAMLVMSLEHRRLQDTNRLNRQFTVFLKWLTEYFLTKRNPEPLESRLTRILDDLLRVLDQGRVGRRETRIYGARLNAAILISDPTSRGPSFRILAQDSCKTFNPMESIPGENSAVGAVFRLGRHSSNSSSLVYVPWTKSSIGVSFQFARAKGAEVVDVMRVIEIPHTPTTEPWQARLGCMLCARIPLDPNAAIDIDGARSFSGYSAVLFIGSQKSNFISSPVFEAARLVSTLLPRVLQIQSSSPVKVVEHQESQQTPLEHATQSAENQREALLQEETVFTKRLVFDFKSLRNRALRSLNIAG
jgi:hypothetical protein